MSAAAWARSGLMALSGTRDGAPVAPRFDAMSRVDRLFAEVAAQTERLGRRVELDTHVLTERACLMGLARHGQVSCNGSARLIEARDGWIAVNLPRPIDLESVPAFVGSSDADDPWTAIAGEARRRDVEDLVEHGRLLALAVAAVTSGRPSPDLWSTSPVTARGEPRARARSPLVVDLTSLWAGPLATHVLAAAGARVIKVESRTRPDSVRVATPVFFDLLHAGKESVHLDFGDANDRARLRGLLERADVVVSSARPRALDQLGIAPQEVLAANPALTWVAITAHGFDGNAAHAIGFGDDAAVAGGLVGWLPDDRPVFLGDALADPLTGLVAALAALDGLRTGGALYDVNLRATSAWTAAASPCDPAVADDVLVAAPRARTPTSKATPAGADTSRVLREFGLH